MARKSIQSRLNRDKIQNLMLRIYRIVILLSFFFFMSIKNVSAESSYVLPYPSQMPGSIFYEINLIQEELLRFWYYGDFGQFKYNLSQADKYLVEAKILFDYKQYLLAYKALIKSDQYFQKIKPAVESAKRKNKNAKDKEAILSEAVLKHIEELEKLEKSLPDSFEWKPEKQQSQTIKFTEILEDSIDIRKKAL